MNWIVKQVIGSKNDREVKRLRKFVPLINEKDEELKALSDDQLKAKTDEFRQRPGAVTNSSRF